MQFIGYNRKTDYYLNHTLLRHVLLRAKNASQNNCKINSVSTRILRPCLYNQLILSLMDTKNVHEIEDNDLQTFESTTLKE
jgi:hypothetical protein